MAQGSPDSFSILLASSTVTDLFYFLHSECKRKHCQLDFLLENQSVFSDALLVTQDVLKKLEECSEIKGLQKEVGTSEICLVADLVFLGYYF